MNEERLRAIESRRIWSYETALEYAIAREGDVLALVAEVRRLRAELTGLALEAERREGLLRDASERLEALGDR